MKTYINLLPWVCQRNQLVALRLRQWLAIGAAVAVVLGVLCVARLQSRQAAESRLQGLKLEYTPTETLSKEITTLRARLAELSSQESTLAQLEDPRPALTLVGLISQSARKCEGRLKVETMALRSSEGPQASAKPGEAAKTAPAPAATSPAPASTAGGATSVSIKGIALDNLAVAQFVVALRQTKAFERVELKASVEHASPGMPARSYLVECMY
jgi:Tfp pilus assembly protein PilN